MKKDEQQEDGINNNSGFPTKTTNSSTSSSSVMPTTDTARSSCSSTSSISSSSNHRLLNNSSSADVINVGRLSLVTTTTASLTETTTTAKILPKATIVLKEFDVEPSIVDFKLNNNNRHVEQQKSLIHRACSPIHFKMVENNAEIKDAADANENDGMMMVLDDVKTVSTNTEKHLVDVSTSTEEEEEDKELIQVESTLDLMIPLISMETNTTTTTTSTSSSSRVTILVEEEMMRRFFGSLIGQDLRYLSRIRLEFGMMKRFGSLEQLLLIHSATTKTTKMKRRKNIRMRIQSNKQIEDKEKEIDIRRHKQTLIDFYLHGKEFRINSQENLIYWTIAKTIKVNIFLFFFSLNETTIRNVTKQ